MGDVVTLVEKAQQDLSDEKIKGEQSIARKLGVLPDKVSGSQLLF